MKTNYTIRDIATKAGVSVATVSYVLNNRTDQKISEETKKKVLQIVNLLGYSGNAIAKSLVTGRTNNIGLYISNQSFMLSQASRFELINKLSTELKSHGYNLTIIPSTYMERVNGVDAIICFDVSKTFFKQIGDKNYCPLIGFESIIDDPLFFEIRSNYDSLFSLVNKEKFKVISLDIESDSVKENLKKSFDITFIKSFSEISTFIRENKDSQVVTLDNCLFEYLQDYIPSVIAYDNHYEEKINKLIECIELAIKREPVENHLFLF